MDACQLILPWIVEQKRFQQICHWKTNLHEAPCFLSMLEDVWAWVANFLTHLLMLDAHGFPDSFWFVGCSRIYENVFCSAHKIYCNNEGVPTHPSDLAFWHVIVLHLAYDHSSAQVRCVPTTTLPMKTQNTLFRWTDEHDIFSFACPNTYWMCSFTSCRLTWQRPTVSGTRSFCRVMLEFTIYFWSWLWCRWQLFCKAWIWTKHSFRKSRNLSLLWCLAWVVVTECDTWEGCCCFLPFYFAAQWGWQQQPRSEQFCVDSRQFLHSLAWQSLMVPSNSMLEE